MGVLQIQALQVVIMVDLAVVLQEELLLPLEMVLLNKEIMEVQVKIQLILEVVAVAPEELVNQVVV